MRIVNFAFVSAFVVVFVVVVVDGGKTSAPGFPVILIPGDGGSHIEARLDKPSVVHYLCTKKTDDFFNIWLNLELMVPFVLDCFIDNVRLVYNNQTRQTSNSPGVETRIPDFGNTSSVEWLDPSKSSEGAYLKDIVETLVAVGYERGISVRGAPYDFRKAPNEGSEYFANLTALIEDTYKINGNLPIVLVAHSLGARYMLYYLNRQSKSWKNKYIHALVTLGGVWGGAVKAMKVYSSGDNLGIYVLSAWTLRDEQITNPSLAFLLPSNKFWSSDEIIISTSTRNYTVNDYATYFQDLNNTDGYNMHIDTKDLINDFIPPEVEIHCMYGDKVDTEERISYTSIPSNSPTITYGPGDGTVNRRSLEGCLRWQGQQSHDIYAQSFDAVDHMTIVRHPPVLNYIKSLVTKTRRKPNNI